MDSAENPLFMGVFEFREAHMIKKDKEVTKMVDEKINDEKYENAKKRVEEIKGFYSHAIVYVCVNIGLFLLDLFTSPGTWWFYWPLLGWGIGLFFHAMGVFIFNRFPGKKWEDRKIEEVMKDMGEDK